MRVGFVTERMLTGFGVDLCVDELATGLARRGHDVTVYCSFEDGTYRDRPYRLRLTPVRSSKFFPRMDRSGRRWSKLIDSDWLDAIEIHSFPFFSMIPRLRTPVVAVDHGVSLTEGMPAWLRADFTYVRQTLYRSYLPRATQVITISNFLRRQMPRGIATRAKVVPWGAEHYWRRVSRAESLAYRRRNAITDDAILALYVGRLKHEAQPYKGVAELLQHFSALRQEGLPLALLCVGFGDDQDAAVISRAGGVAVISAPVEEMPLAYSASDIFASCSRWEGFGLPLLEAQRYGLAAVAYARGAHPEIAVKDHTALLVETPDQFRASWRELVVDGARREALGVAARQHAETFTWERAVDAHEQALEKAAQTRPASARHTLLPLRREERPLVSAVVLSYEPEAKHLNRCVESLLASTYRHIEVVLVDNGSGNGVCAQVAAQHPDVKFVPLERNTGFSGGINRGVESASGGLVFLINPDAEVEPDTVTTLVEAARRRPDVIGFAPKMLFSHDHDLIDSVGTAIDDMGAAFNRGIGQFDIGQYDWEEPVMGACFGAAMIRREAFLPHRVGMLDERFFLYYEDVDWCLRAVLLGEHFWSVPAARVFHVHSATTRLQAYAFKYRLIERNLLRTVFRNFEKKRAVKVFVVRSVAHLRNIAFGRFRLASARALVEGWWSIALYWGARTVQQRRRVASDGDAFKLNHGEHAFFDPVHYAPTYKWETLAMMLRRMWVMTADNRWQQATAYVESVSVSPLKFRPRIALERLESLAGPLPPQVLRFVEALERQPGMMVAKPAAGEPELESLLGPGEDARTA